MTQVNISKNIVLDVDFDKIMSHPALVADAVRFAVKQALTNTHAAIKNDEPDAVAKATALAVKRLAVMYSGSWGSTERASGPRDPIGKEMSAMAEADLVKKLPAGKKVKDYDKAVWAKVVAMQVAKNEAAYRAAAEAKLAIKPDTGDESADDILAMLTETPAE